MENTVRQFIARERLLTTADLHLVALSGGADSVALLLVLLALGYRVEAVHCNFHLRGDESDRDERFVRSLCSQHGVGLHLAHFDTATYASLHHQSIEMAARTLRYRYFEQLRRDVGASRVCVAHHRDDAVETLLMNLVRGTGIHGLTGIRPQNGHVVRPLLCVSRADVEAYLRRRQQPYVTDSTNLVPDVLRNRLRLQVLPLLSELNPAAPANIALTARRMADAERLCNAATSDALSRLFHDGAIAIADLMGEPSPQLLLFELLTPRAFTPAQVDQVYAALARPVTGREFSSPTYDVVIDRGRLLIAERRPPLPTLRLPEPGRYRYADCALLTVERSAAVSVSRDPFRATLDAATVSFPLTVRPVRQADRFCPYGMKGSRLVSDYLTDRKRSLLQKRRQLAVADANGQLLWLVGERTDQRFAVTPSTTGVVVITYTETEPTN